MVTSDENESSEKVKSVVDNMNKLNLPDENFYECGNKVIIS